MITGTVLPRADLREQVDAVHLRHHHVEQHEIRVLARSTWRSASPASPASIDLVALVAEQARHEGPNLRIVVDDEHQRHVVSHSR